jgi:hypothetical protein
MTKMFVRHQVNDYGVWRKAYDDFGAKRNQLGVTGAAVFRAADDANDITVTHDFESLEAAQAFAGSDELRSAMDQAGVAGPPTIWFANEA